MSYLRNGSNYILNFYKMVDYRQLDNLLLTEKPKTIFEFGTFDGTDTLHYSNLLPDAEIWTFDADKRSVGKIKKKIDGRNIHAYHYAITDHCGKVAFYTSTFTDGEPGCSGSIKKHTRFHKKNQIGRQIFSDIPIFVPAMTIEKFCLDNNIERIDFLHSDTEGNVEEVINGFGKFLPGILRIEIYEISSNYEGVMSHSYYDNIIRSLGYEYLFGIEYDAVYKLKS